jgi:hypothetical protein
MWTRDLVNIVKSEAAREPLIYSSNAITGLDSDPSIAREVLDRQPHEPLPADGLVRDPYAG